MDTMVLGVLAFSALCLAGGCLYYNRPLPGLFISLGAMVFLGLTGRSWFFMLVSSGKETALLGFHRYPAVSVALLVLALLAVSGILFSITMLVRRKYKK